jgi:hypothetical protein
VDQFGVQIFRGPTVSQYALSWTIQTWDTLSGQSWKNDHLHESSAVYKMQKAESQEEFQSPLIEHDRMTDADGKPRLVARTLEEFWRGPAVKP